jgi:hypothetical protein
LAGAHRSALGIVTGLLRWSYMTIHLAGAMGTILGGLAFIPVPDRIGSRR